MTERATIAPTRAEDGSLSGAISIGVKRWAIVNWRQGGDKLHILFDVAEIDNADTLRVMRELGG